MRDRRGTVSITGIVGMSLALITFLVRLMARMITGKLEMDDWTVMVAMVSATDVGRLL